MNNKKSKKPIPKLALVVDLEACCWRGNPPEGQYKEIIEIGIAAIDYKTKEVVKSRSILIKPQFSEISKFCTELTTITPEMVEKEGVSFKKACEILKKEFHSERRIWFSWGDYDREAFEKECAFKKIKYPFGKNHINLKELYVFKYGLKQAPSVSNALKRFGIEFEGRPHRGYIDALNTAHILREII